MILEAINEENDSLE